MKATDSLVDAVIGAAPKKARDLFNILVSNLGIKDGGRRGEKYRQTGFYTIRIQPSNTSEVSSLLDNTEKFVKSQNAKKAGIKYIRTVDRMHSAKFSSVLISYCDINFGIVTAAGANKGESFEKDMLTKMNNLIEGVENSKEAELALQAIMKADVSIRKDKILSVVARTGSTLRSAVMSSDEAGKIIADIIIKMKNGKEHYVSLKNISGSTIAQFGCSEVFNNDFSVNESSEKWKKWIGPLGLDVRKIQKGLEAYSSKQQPDFNTEENVNRSIKSGSAVYKMMESMWGTGYIYLREQKNGFDAFAIGHKYLADNVLKDLKMIKILYPCPIRKSIEVHLQSASGGYKIRMRNKNDPVSLRPTIIQLEKTK